MKKVIIAVIVLIMFIVAFNNKLSTLVNIKDSGEELDIYVINDIHLLASSLHDDNKIFNDLINNGDGKTLNYIEVVLDAFFEEAQEDNIDIVVVNGDLTLNGEKESHKELADIFSDFEEETGIEVLVTPGNHDIQNPYARGYKNDEWFETQSISYDEFSDIYKDFGYDQAEYRDENSNSYMYEASEDVYLLMLDTTIVGENLQKPITNGELPFDTLSWIEQMGEKAKEDGADLLTFSHHNILDHDASTNEGLTVDNSTEVFNTFKDINAQVVFTGHSHSQDITSKTEEDYTLYDIVTASVAINPHSYGSISYLNGEVDFETKNVDVESYAQKHNLTDENLLNFKEYSENLFYNITYNRIMSNYDTNKYTEQEIADMSNVVTTAHMAVIEDNSENINDLIKDLDGYDLIVNDESNYYYEYIKGLIDSDNEHIDSIKIELKKV